LQDLTPVVSSTPVERLVSNALEKLGARNRPELAARLRGRAGRMRETPDDPGAASLLASSRRSPTREERIMAMIVVLVPVSEAEPSLQPGTVSELARLGVTSVAVVRDERTLGLVIEGWAFDPSRSGKAAVAAVAGRSSSARTLHPLAEMAVSTARSPLGGEES
jgi:hypothetical protein